MLRSVMTPPVFHIKQKAYFELDHGELLCYDDTLCADLTACDIDLSKSVFRARIYKVEGQCAFLALSIHHVRFADLDDSSRRTLNKEPLPTLCLCAWLTCLPAWLCQVVLDGPSQQVVYSTLSQILAGTRCGLVTEHTVSEANNESKLANDALVSHLGRLEAGSDESGPQPHPLLLPGALTRADDTTLVFGMRNIRRAISPVTVGKLNRIAARHDITLNSILLGTLATQLWARSGQDQFAINQTYLGRRPDQLRAVGSYSHGVAMEFTFNDKTSLRDVCQSVFAETLRNMAAPDRVANATLESNISYELNDVRHLPRPSSLPNTPVVLVDLFFVVCEYLDGLDAILSYDVSKFEDSDAELLLEDWMLALEGLDDLESTYLPRRPSPLVIRR
jgi:hypothetical protein